MIKLTQYNFDICKQLFGAPVILHSVIIGWYIHVWASLMTEIILLTLLMQPFGRFWMMSSIIGCKQFGHVSLRTGRSVGSRTNCETCRQMTFKTPVLKSKYLPGDNY